MIAILVGSLLVAGSALAGAKLKIDDESSINLAFRVQTLGISTDRDLDTSTAGWENYMEWKVRRARFRLGAVVNEHVSCFLQTDHSGKDVQMIDAFINMKVNPWLQFIMGRNMAPALRQNMTSSGALMCIDRPGSAYRSLTWGARALHTFSNATFMSSGLSSSVDAVRDNGLTVFGSGPAGSSGNFKYYAGIYNGIQAGPNDEHRTSFRAQYNLWDAEAGYYNSSTYLGKKKTLAFGFAYDAQKEVGDMGSGTAMVDYALMTVDVFLEYPTTGGSFTFEGAYIKNDFDDHPDMLHAQGPSMYVQAGYYVNSGWQPWFMYESFSSDATATVDEGSFTNMRIGVTRFLKGQNANIKLGYESFKSELPIVGNEDTIASMVLGFYTTY